MDLLEPVPFRPLRFRTAPRLDAENVAETQSLNELAAYTSPTSSRRVESLLGGPVFASSCGSGSDTRSRWRSRSPHRRTSSKGTSVSPARTLHLLQTTPSPNRDISASVLAETPTLVPQNLDPAQPLWPASSPAPIFYHGMPPSMSKPPPSSHSVGEFSRKHVSPLSHTSQTLHHEIHSPEELLYSAPSKQNSLYDVSDSTPVGDDETNTPPVQSVTRRVLLDLPHKIHLPQDSRSLSQEESWTPKQSSLYVDASPAHTGRHIPLDRSAPAGPDDSRMSPQMQPESSGLILPHQRFERPPPVCPLQPHAANMSAPEPPLPQLHSLARPPPDVPLAPHWKDENDTALEQEVEEKNKMVPSYPESTKTKDARGMLGKVKHFLSGDREADRQLHETNWQREPEERQAKLKLPKKKGKPNIPQLHQTLQGDFDDSSVLVHSPLASEMVFGTPSTRTSYLSFAPDVSPSCLLPYPSPLSFWDARSSKKRVRPPPPIPPELQMELNRLRALASLPRFAPIAQPQSDDHVAPDLLFRYHSTMSPLLPRDTPPVPPFFHSLCFSATTSLSLFEDCAPVSSASPKSNMAAEGQKQAEFNPQVFESLAASDSDLDSPIINGQTQVSSNSISQSPVIACVLQPTSELEGSVHTQVYLLHSEEPAPAVEPHEAYSQQTPNNALHVEMQAGDLLPESHGLNVYTGDSYQLDDSLMHLSAYHTPLSPISERNESPSNNRPSRKEYDEQMETLDEGMDGNEDSLDERVSRRYSEPKPMTLPRNSQTFGSPDSSCVNKNSALDQEELTIDSAGKIDSFKYPTLSSSSNLSPSPRSAVPKVDEIERLVPGEPSKLKYERSASIDSDDSVLIHAGSADDFTIESPTSPDTPQIGPPDFSRLRVPDADTYIPRTPQPRMSFSPSSDSSDDDHLSFIITDTSLPSPLKSEWRYPGHKLVDQDQTRIHLDSAPHEEKRLDENEQQNESDKNENEIPLSEVLFTRPRLLSEDDSVINICPTTRSLAICSVDADAQGSVQCTAVPASQVLPSALSSAPLHGTPPSQQPLVFPAATPSALGKPLMSPQSSTVGSGAPLVSCSSGYHTTLRTNTPSGVTLSITTDNNAQTPRFDAYRSYSKVHSPLHVPFCSPCAFSISSDLSPVYLEEQDFSTPDQSPTTIASYSPLNLNEPDVLLHTADSGEVSSPVGQNSHANVDSSEQGQVQSAVPISSSSPVASSSFSSPSLSSSSAPAASSSSNPSSSTRLCLNCSFMNVSYAKCCGECGFRLEHDTNKKESSSRCVHMQSEGTLCNECESVSLSQLVQLFPSPDAIARPVGQVTASPLFHTPRSTHFHSPTRFSSSGRLPRDSPSPSSDSSSASRACVMKLLSDEVHYAENLHRLSEFRTPLLKVETSAELASLFRTVEWLEKFSRKFQANLDRKLHDWDDLTTVGDVFLLFGPFVTTGVAFEAEYAQASSAIVVLRAESRTFNEVFMQGEQTCGVSFDSLCASIAQRTIEYKKIVQELREKTPTAHEDFSLLSRALLLFST